MNILFFVKITISRVNTITRNIGRPLIGWDGRGEGVQDITASWLLIGMKVNC